MRGVARRAASRTLTGLGARTAESTGKLMEVQAALRGPDVIDTLRLVTDWNFDIFRLDEVSGNRPLSVIAYHMLVSVRRLLWRLCARVCDRCHTCE